MRNVIDFKDLGGQAHEVTMGADYVLERQKLLKVNYFFIDNFFNFPLIIILEKAFGGMFRENRSVLITNIL